MTDDALDPATFPRAWLPFHDATAPISRAWRLYEIEQVLAMERVNIHAVVNDAAIRGQVRVAWKRHCVGRQIEADGIARRNAAYWTWWWEQVGSYFPEYADFPLLTPGACM